VGNGGEREDGAKGGDGILVTGISLNTQRKNRDAKERESPSNCHRVEGKETQVKENLLKTSSAFRRTPNRRSYIRRIAKNIACD